MEALLLSAIGMLQCYMLTRIDGLNGRVDELKGALSAQQFQLRFLMSRFRTRKEDEVKQTGRGDSDSK